MSTVPSGASSRDGGRAPRSSHLRRLIGWLLIALASFSSLAIGTVHDWTRTVVFSGCTLVFLLTLVERRRRHRCLPINLAAFGLIVVLAATIVQLIPLPAGVLAWLSPHAHEVFSTALGAYRWHALSLDPSGSIGELAKLVGYFLFLVATSAYVTSPRRQSQVVTGIIALATLVAIVGLVQVIANTDEVLFFYVPRAHTMPLVRGSFVNPNHFGALVGLAAPCALALALRKERFRAFYMSSTAILNVAGVLSLSRGTIVTMAFGQLLVFVLDRIQLRYGAEWQRRSGARVLLGVVVAVSVLVAVVEDPDRLAVESDSATISHLKIDPKIRTWERAASLVALYPWTGVGRGAFEPAFTQVTERAGVRRTVWVENVYLQVLCDWGVPVGALLLALGTSIFFLAARRLSDEPRLLGPFVAVVTLALHEAADFAVELPGVALPALALVACLLAQRSSASGFGQRPLRVRLPHFAVVPAVVLLIVLAGRLRTAEADASSLARAARDPRRSTADVLALGKEMVHRHPAAYLLPALLGERLARDGNLRAIPLLNHAMYLNPAHPAPHVTAAEILAVRGHKEQALGEYRLAVAGTNNPSTIWARVLKVYGSAADLLAATPDDPRILTILAGWMVEHNLHADAERTYLRVLDLRPNDIIVLQRLVSLSVASGAHQTAAARVQRLLALDDSTTSKRLAIEASLSAADTATAAALLDAGVDDSDATFDLEILVVKQYLQRGDLSAAGNRITRIDGRWRGNRLATAKIHEARAQLERQAGNEHQSRWELEQAQRLREQ